MKVAIELLGLQRARPPAGLEGPRVTLELEDEAASLDDVARRLGLGESGWIAFLDGEVIHGDHRLRHGDRVTLVGMVGGG
jgi:sulfur carrier protein ThiS